MNTTDTPTVIATIVAQAKEHARIEIGRHGAEAIAEQFAFLQQAANQLKQFDPHYVAPWDSAPPVSKLVEKKPRNVEEAILRVMVPGQSYSVNDIIERLRVTGLIYNPGTVCGTLSRLKCNQKYCTTRHGVTLIRFNGNWVGGKWATPPGFMKVSTTP